MTPKEKNLTEKDGVAILGKQLKAFLKVASKKEGRASLEFVWFDEAPSGNARLWSTDGRMLLIKEFPELDPPSVPLYYDQDSIKRVLAKDIIDVHSGGIFHDGCYMTPFMGRQYQPPDIDACIPRNRDEPWLSPSIVGMGIDLLSKALKALGDLTLGAQVGTYQLGESNNDPVVITVESQNAMLVIMPCRVGKALTVNELLNPQVDEEKEEVAA